MGVDYLWSASVAALAPWVQPLCAVNAPHHPSFFEAFFRANNPDSEEKRQQQDANIKRPLPFYVTLAAGRHLVLSGLDSVFHQLRSLSTILAEVSASGEESDSTGSVSVWQGVRRQLAQLRHTMSHLEHQLLRHQYSDHEGVPGALQLVARAMEHSTALANNVAALHPALAQEAATPTHTVLRCHAAAQSDVSLKSMSFHSESFVSFSLLVDASSHSLVWALLYLYWLAVALALGWFVKKRLIV
eukprot:TRINITY_DN3645_c0_g1_i4.p1 TRINITY_DN3645_c0_g1~~TRINITY_DN3645_c0_g1_i4.p1  ORF type:complete len:244 (-),score=40.95 TRINITY_DN3645_c0_g1_i4:18-749(-)